MYKKNKLEVVNFIGLENAKKEIDSKRKVHLFVLTLLFSFTCIVLVIV